MATLQDYIDAVDRLLDHPLGASHFQLISRVSGKVYEAYVFGLCVRAARELNATVELRAIEGLPNPFVFRGAPGQIYSRTRNYGYAWFSLNDEEFEIHSAVEYMGTSKMIHEIDVSIIRGSDAEKCRSPRSSADPLSRSLVGIWECKFHAGNLPKVEGRTFVGLVDDMGASSRLRGLCSNTRNDQLGLYFSKKSRPHPHFNLTPLEPSNEDSFVEHVKTELNKLAPPR